MTGGIAAKEVVPKQYEPLSSTIVYSGVCSVLDASRSEGEEMYDLQVRGILNLMGLAHSQRASHSTAHCTSP